MLPLIPAFIALTLVIGYVLAPKDRDPDERLPAAISTNLLMQHSSAVEIADRNDMSYGSVTGSVGGPFRDMAEWESRVVSSGSRTIVVTYAHGDPEDRNVLRAFGQISDETLVRMPKTYAGRYEFDGAGTGGYVDGQDFTDLVIPVGNHVPVVVTVIRETPPAPPGGGGGNGGTGGSDGGISSEESQT
ncbi:hypothetical protein [Defluviimonas salinarum]|uniref:Secreted protein n=1 Tax=Defluviimonas salinarum TaxID=2992147 RepID=A0ABT3J4G0_9RHOB|nr:hypothetical protein [Defluviimonas salinarum]MCW3782563.1 hypothetical protein [Defluviimonas salinarum]